MFEIACSKQGINAVHEVLNSRQGEILEDIELCYSLLYKVTSHPTQERGYLPVAEATGFESALKEAAKEAGLSHYRFSHWRLQPDQLVRQIRKRKGMREDLPVISEYSDGI